MDVVVAVCGFTFVASWFPLPFSLLPMAGALLMPSDAITGSFVGMGCALLFGTLSSLIKAGRS